MAIVTTYIAPIHAPWTHKALVYNDVMKIREYLQPGDIINTRTHGELSTLLIPDFWKHSAIYRGHGTIIDATGVGVQVRHLEDLVLKTDNICILRANGINADDRKRIVKYAEQYIGTSYDVEFNSHDTKQLYCSELVYRAVNQVKMGYLELRERLGIQTITPSDLYKAKSKFDLIMEIRK